ncbi:MAG: hypothetical protein WCS70_04230 [Verrucomicrobiota bacterium]
MNVSLKLRLLVPITAAAFLLGCGKSEEKTPAAAAEATKAAASSAMDATKSAAADATEAVKPAANTQADGLIAKAQSLMANKSYTEAATVLKDLAALKLTPEQQKIVDGLKAQLQKYMSTDAAAAANKAAGSLLGK